MATKNRKKSVKITSTLRPSLVVSTPYESEKVGESVLDVVEKPGAPQVEPGAPQVEPEAPQVEPQVEPQANVPVHQCETISEPKAINSFRAQLQKSPGLMLAAAIILPLSIIFFSKILVPLTFCVLAIFACQEIGKFLPKSVQEKIEKSVERNLFMQKVGKPISYGVQQIRPFLLAGVTFWSGPFLVVWMFALFVKRLFAKKEKFVRADRFSPDKIIIEQSVSKPMDDEEDANFYHSPAFAITLLGIFALGIPAAVTFCAYNIFGIDALMGHPSADRHFTKNIVVIGFYISSIAWCMSTLFFRAWFSYPLNFYSNAYDVILDSKAIEKKNIKGWFAELVWFCYPEYVPVKLKWEDVASVKFVQGGFGRLYPLPSTLFSAESLMYKSLNKIAMYTDALVDRVGRCDYIEFKPKSAVGSSLKLRLWQMNKEERARVFYAIRKWAPLLVIPQNVQELLLGSAVLAEARYTQIWFDLLTSKSQRVRRDLLEPGDSLKDGALKVISKLESGGQANVYLAGNAAGETVVLKEFILTGDDDMGNLIDSAADFENEGSILARLNHPNVVKLADVFTEDRRVYLVLEHVEGQSLRQLVNQSGPLSEKEAIRLGLEMCKILEYLHSYTPSIIHRDFTPDNLILMPDGTLKVIDFSVAGSSASVKDGDCVGKHSYTPAEQFRGQPCPQSDLYALGATMYFLTVGTDPPPITQLRPAQRATTLSAEFDAIVFKLTAIDLLERYETATWLGLELSALQEKAYIIV